MDYICGLDIGQRQDYTASVLINVNKLIDKNSSISKTTIESLEVVAITRFKLGTFFTDIADEIASGMTKLLLKSQIQPKLVIDITGNYSITELFNAKNNPYELFKVVPVIITGGSLSSFDKGVYNVPKYELIFRTNIALEQYKLKFAEGMPFIDILIDELRNYGRSIKESGTEIFNARSGEHDDLVLALSLAVWMCVKDGYTKTEYI